MINSFFFFNQDDRAHQTSLCDFQFRPIDVEKYTTFREYIDEHGLNGHSTAVYLCTREGWILFVPNFLTTLPILKSMVLINQEYQQQKKEKKL